MWDKEGLLSSAILIKMLADLPVKIKSDSVKDYRYCTGTPGTGSPLPTIWCFTKSADLKNVTNQRKIYTGKGVFAIIKPTIHTKHKMKYNLTGFYVPFLGYSWLFRFYAPFLLYHFLLERHNFKLVVIL